MPQIPATAMGSVSCGLLRTATLAMTDCSVHKATAVKAGSASAAKPVTVVRIETAMRTVASVAVEGVQSRVRALPLEQLTLATLVRFAIPIKIRLDLLVTSEPLVVPVPTNALRRIPVMRRHSVSLTIAPTERRVRRSLGVSVKTHGAFQVHLERGRRAEMTMSAPAGVARRGFGIVTRTVLVLLMMSYALAGRQVEVPCRRMGTLLVRAIAVT